MALFDLHRDSIAAFLGRSDSDWTVALNTWNTNRDLEDAVRREYRVEKSSRYQTTFCMDKREKV